MEVISQRIEDRVIHNLETQNKDTLSQSGFEKFRKLGLPGRKSEAYKFTPITALLGKNFKWEKVDANGIWSKEECQSAFYPVKEAHHLVFVNGSYVETFSILNAEDQALTITSLNREDKRLGNFSGAENDVFEGLNAAFTQQGLELSVKKNDKSLPVFLYHFIDSTDAEQYLFPRILVHAQKGGELHIFEKTNFKGDLNSLTVSIFEASVSANASVAYTKTQDFPKHAFAVEGIYADLDKDSRFYTNTYSFDGAVIRNNIQINILGENCEGHMNGIYLLDGKTHVDNNTAVDHKHPHSFSNELYKGILKGQSKGVFNGKIYVRPNAQKTNAFQSNNNVMLSENATIHTKPQLEIWADDVKCSHGCTVGQLDEEAIFYLQSRGILKKDAIALVLNAFAGEALNEVGEELVKEAIEQRVEKGLTQ